MGRKEVFYDYGNLQGAGYGRNQIPGLGLNGVFIMLFLNHAIVKYISAYKLRGFIGLCEAMWYVVESKGDTSSLFLGRLQ
jgi:hypothetical protein